MTLKEWFKIWISGKPHEVIGGKDDPYMLRWYVIPYNTKTKIFIHKFLRSDDDRALHDHPWWFFSVVLKGSYLEHIRTGPWTSLYPDKHEFYGESVILRSAPSFAFRPVDHVHRVELLKETETTSKPCWTLVVTGPKVKPWGFWCPSGFVQWQDFDRMGGCGEA